MEISENYPLQNHNTFGIAATCRYFAEFNSIAELKEILATDIALNNPLLILGGGSNVLFTNDFPGIVILNQLKGIEIAEEDDSMAVVAAFGGEVWQDLVNFSLDNELGGLENLSLIPGSVGAAPIQNIGAYGVELKDVMHSLEAYNLATGQMEIFSNTACEFGYRNSVFKNKLKDKYLITKVFFTLAKQPEINTSYGVIAEVLQANNIDIPTIRDISRTVIEIRQSKLPDPTVLGNAGSFFKNPVVDLIDYEGLKLTFSDIPGYVNKDQVKIPAAWLIDQCGWKGKRFGHVGVHENQPLVLVNYGGGTGKEIKELADNISRSVADKFGIVLEAEPRII